jgi:spore germination protein GerM
MHSFFCVHLLDQQTTNNKQSNKQTTNNKQQTTNNTHQTNNKQQTTNKQQATSNVSLYLLKVDSNFEFETPNVCRTSARKVATHYCTQAM